MKSIKYILISVLLLSVSFTQTSTTIIGGTGTALTSAHITIGTNASRCPDAYVIQTGASLTPSDATSTCGATLSTQSISGYVKDSGGNPIDGVSVAFSNGGPTVTTNTSGFYTADVSYGWSGTATPSGKWYAYTPGSITYTNVTADQVNQDYVGSLQYVKVSGLITWSSTTNPMEGVDVAFSNGGPTVTTDSDGYYEAFMIMPYSGTSTPSAGGCTFAPSSITYTNISAKEENQDYVGSSIYVTISGFIKDANAIPIEGVAVAFSNGGPTVTTDIDGYYEAYMIKPYSGTSTPSKTGYSFDPSSYSYSLVSLKQDNQDYVGTNLTLAINDYLNSLPTEFTVLPAYPNPFNPSVTIRYGLDTDSKVTVQIYDITGHIISTLVNTNALQGWHSVIWNGTNQHGEQTPAGLYFSRIVAGNDVKTSKLMLLK